MKRKALAEGFELDADQPALVIGAAGVDYIGRVKAPLRPHTSNPASIIESFGGVARNVAENLARLGQSVSLLTAVGDDRAGSTLLDYTASAGVDVSNVIKSGQYPTGAYIALVGQGGELEYGLDDMRVLAELTPEALKSREALFQEASVLFMDANLPKDTLRTAISLARKAHIPICADPTSIDLASRLQPHLRHFFMLTPNSAEAGLLNGQPFPDSDRRQALDAAQRLVAAGVKIAIITRAEFGVVYATSETKGRISALNTRVVDPTGAGDAFTAAMIFAMLNDIPIDDAVRLGISAASLTLSYPGTVVPDLSLEKLYDRLLI
jgi:pseudouridine kinase